MHMRVIAVGYEMLNGYLSSYYRDRQRIAEGQKQTRDICYLWIAWFKFFIHLQPLPGPFMFRLEPGFIPFHSSSGGDGPFSGRSLIFV